jgi:ADP-heptose:LPS heptosyltransferase
VKRILVIALSGIGDSLIATPLLRQLRIRYPAARIEALVLWPGAASLLGNNPNLDAVHQFPFHTAPKLDALQFVAGLRRHRYDLSINIHTQGRREYRVIAWLIGARIRASHAYENQSWLDRLLVTHSLPQDYSVHGAVNNQRLLELVSGAPVLEPPRYELRLEADEVNWAAAQARSLGLNRATTLGIHVGSGGTKNLALRRWPLELHLALARRLLADVPGLKLAYFGGPDEVAPHARLRSELASEVEAQRCLFPSTPSVRHAAALLGNVGGFLSVDTLFMHLAAAMRVPRQWVIETPTVNPPILPLREAWTLIPNPAVAGRNLDYYRYDGRPISGTPESLHAIMSSVTVDAVASALGEYPPVGPGFKPRAA